MNLNEYPRITILPFPSPDDKDQKNVNRKFIDCLKMLSRRDDDKEARLRAIDTSRGVSRYTIDQLLAPLTALSHQRQHSLISALDHTSLVTPGYLLRADANGLPIEAGASRVGGAVNYTEFETDGTVIFNGDATVWDDMRVVPGSFDRPGISDPSIVAYDVNGGGVSTYLWEFAKNNVASFTVQLPHGYRQGTDIYAHIHWTPGPRGAAENGNFVGWKLQYSWANINANFPTMLSLDLSDVCDGTDHKHQMTPEVVIDGHTVSKDISSMLICNVLRTDTGGDDTWVGTLSGQRPMLLEIDFHYQIDMVGSHQQSIK